MKYKILCISVVIIHCLTLNSYGNKISTEFSKKWEKEFEVSPDATLKISNKYGTVHTTSWQKNIITIMVIASVDVDSKEKADKILNHIDIVFDASKQEVNVTTEIQDLPEKMNKELQIDYTVMMPKTNNLSIKNKFGDVYVNELDGKVDIKVGYGNVKCGNLNNSANKLDISFGAGSIDNFTSGNIILRYSELNIDNGENITIDSQFSTLDIGSVKTLNNDSQYDKTGIKQVRELNIDGKFSTFKIYNIIKSFKLDTEFGNCSVKNISRDFKEVIVDNQFGGVELGFEEGASFQLIAEAQLGDVDFPRKMTTINKETKGITSYEMSGIVGNDKSPKSLVNITTKHGDVELDFN
ncbi:MAG: hypothetical protein ABII90_06270 [Bacteroidota bacterium]